MNDSVLSRLPVKCKGAAIFGSFCLTGGEEVHTALANMGLDDEEVMEVTGKGNVQR